MKAYLIDPFEKTIEEVDHTGHYTHIYELIGVDCFDLVRLNRDGDVIYVDDVGLTRPNQRYFCLEGYPQPLAGKGLVLGSDFSGESVSPSIDLTQLKGMISWARPDLQFAGEDVTEEDVDHPIFGKVRSIRKTPIFKTGD